MAKDKLPFIFERLRGFDLGKMAEAIEIDVDRLREIALQNSPMTASEAIAIGKHLSLNPKKLLDTQTEEQLAAAGYVEPKAKEPKKPEPAARSPMPDCTPKRSSGRVIKV